MRRFNETYRNRKFITRNTWADTYKAVHSETEEKITLKVLVNQSNDEEYIKFLSEEVEKLKKIRNTNLININGMFEYSAFGKRYSYIEGEYFKGITLREKITLAKLRDDEAVKITLELVEGIREFHKAKISFNNLTLDNIYINKKNIVKIDVMSYLENKKYIMISKENLEENQNIEEEFTPNKDIYDLGVVLFSLISGNINFKNNQIRRHIKNNNLVKVIEKATNDQLDNRYLSIDRFVADLKSYLLHGELSNERDFEEEKLPVKNKRKKGKFGKTLGICATIAIVAGGSIYGYDLIQKNNHMKSNTEIINEKKEEQKEKEEIKEIKEEKKDIQKDISEDKSSTTNNMNKNEAPKNNSLNNSSNSTSNKPNVETSKPSNNQNSGTTSTVPNEGNNSENIEPKPEVPTTPTPTPTPDVPNDGNGEVVTPEVPSVQ